MRLTDREGTYQYKAFGVPGLGLKRGLEDELVIAPYATALASLVDPPAAAMNLERLAAEGAEGRFGFYESIDYSSRAGVAATDASPDHTTPGTRACLFQSSPGHVARRVDQRDRQRRLRLPVPCRPAGPGDRTAAAGAGAARGHRLGTAARRGRAGAALGARARVAGDSDRRTRPARIPTSSPTAATPRR